MRLHEAVFAGKDGFVERECPSCYFIYKIRSADWESKVFEYEVFCPKCKTSSPSDNWWTHEQVELIKHLLDGKNYCGNEPLIAVRGLKNRFEGVSGYENREFRRNSAYTFENNDVGIKHSFENNIVCNSCGTEFRTVGGAFVCPCCSFDNVLRCYPSFLEKTEEMLFCIKEMKEIIANLKGEDEAELFEREALYYTAEDIVLCFNTYCRKVFSVIGIDKYCEMNFGTVAKTNKEFLSVFGRGIADKCEKEYLNSAETVFAEVNSFLNKKKKEKTPRIVLQDVVLTVKTLKNIVERIRAIAFGKAV